MDSPSSTSSQESLLFRMIAPQERSLVRMALLAALLLTWIAILVILYFINVRPGHEHRPATQGLAAQSVSVCVG